MAHGHDSYYRDLQPSSKVKPFELFAKKILSLYLAFFLSLKNLLFKLAAPT